MKMLKTLFLCFFLFYSITNLADECLELGNPSNAVNNPSNLTNYLMVKNQYCLSYNSSLNTANWVAWHLGINDLGNTKRSNSFVPDQTLPSGWYRVKSSDYTNSGYDRGHMCPSADRTATPDDNRATFLTTNITPQKPDVNQGPWEKLEEYERSLVESGKELYIYDGIVDSSGYIYTADNHKINVPGDLWKIIVVLDEGTGDLSRIDNETRVIAVVMPNVVGIRGKDWKAFIQNVDYIEHLTNYDFLSNVPKQIQEAIEEKNDDEK